MFNIKTLAIATAISAGVVFAMPVASQAMPQNGPVKIDTAQNSNIVEVRHRSKRFARYCRRNWDDPRCHRSHRAARYQRDRYYDRYDDRYDEPYYGRHRRDRGPGVGLYFNID